MRNGYGAVFLAGNHGRDPGLLDVGAHVARVLGPVNQYGLAPGQGQGANPAAGVAAQVEFGGEAAPAVAERITNGAVFSFAPAATWCARTAVGSTMSRCKTIAFWSWASTCGLTPAWRQRQKRTYTLCQGPKCSTGRSYHETPPRAHQSTATTNKGASLAVVPGDCSWPGSSGASRAHCVSVNMLRTLFKVKSRP